MYRAYELVAANRGSHGVDGQSLDDFEGNLRDNLYKIWNRMSSGSYFPSAVRRVDIPKSGGGSRPLGIPTVSDRIAQMVVKLYLEPQIEPHFHESSYGYRPNRSALQAVGIARRNCWKHSWVLDMDIQGFFENIDHALLMKAVRKHTDSPWQLLYIQRFLTTDVMHADGRTESRQSGTPQGGVISPLLANLFLHYVFDDWMDRHWSGIQFERYADDIICHCASSAQAELLLGHIRQRMEACKLTLHPQKTKVVQCCKENQKAVIDYEQQFDFLGYTFCQRTVHRKDGSLFRNMLPAMSRRKEKDIRNSIRQDLSSSSTHRELRQLAAQLNERVRGWYAYFDVFYGSMCRKRIGRFIDQRIMKWAMKKYKRLKRSSRKASQWFKRLRKESPDLFWHWTVETA